MARYTANNFTEDWNTLTRQFPDQLLSRQESFSVYCVYGEKKELE